MKKNIKILLSGVALLTLVVVVFIMNNSNRLAEEKNTFRFINIDLSKMIEEEREKINIDISETFKEYEDENNKMFEKYNSKLIRL